MLLMLEKYNNASKQVRVVDLIQIFQKLLIVKLTYCFTYTSYELNFMVKIVKDNKII